jgi:hypothetical protein
MSDQSFEDKIRASLEGFQDTTPPTQAEWARVMHGLQKSGKGFWFYFWPALAGVLLLLSAGYAGFTHFQHEHFQTEMKAMACEIENNNLLAQQSHIATSEKDTVVVYQHSVDTIYIIDQISNRIKNSSVLSNQIQSLKNDLNDLKSMNKSDVVIINTTKTSKEFSATDTKSTNASTPKNESIVSSTKPTLVSENSDVNNPSNTVIENELDKLDKNLAQPGLIAKDSLSKEKATPEQEEPKEEKAEVQEEEPQKLKEPIQKAFFVGVNGKYAKPFGNAIKENSLNRLGVSGELRLSDRVGLSIGAAYSQLKFEHIIDFTAFSSVPNLDLSYYDVYTTLRNVTVPIHLRLYFRPNQEINPFINVGVSTAVYAWQHYRFTDSDLYDDYYYRIKSGGILPQFLHLGAGTTIFRKNGFGTELEFHYDYGIQDFGVQQFKLNALGGSIRLFYEL